MFESQEITKEEAESIGYKKWPLFSKGKLLLVFVVLVSAGVLGSLIICKGIFSIGM